MGSTRLFAAVLMLVVLVAAGWWVKRELQIDSCLDMGGRWDYELKKCQVAPASHSLTREAESTRNIGTETLVPGLVF